MKKIFLYALVAFGVLINTSCNKQLDALPQNARVEGNAITDQPSANVALNGVYYVFANGDNSQTNWKANKVFGSMAAGYIAYGSGSINEEVDNFNNTTFGGEWDRNYRLVNAANGVISGVQTVADSKFVGVRKVQILAEARFLRAYANFKLLTFFGQWFDITSKYGIILEDQFNNLTNINKPRSSVKDSYDFIIADLDYAIANGAATSKVIYANKWTAMALKMRVLLSRGNGNDYADAVTLGNTITGSSPYVLEDNQKDIFYTKGQESSEVMLAVQPQPNQEFMNNNTSQDFAFTNSSSPYQATQALKDLYPATDPRGAWVVGPAVKSNKNYYFIKYVQPVLQPTSLSEVAYAFRLSEVYLMLAEATVRSGSSNIAAAKILLKTIMGKAGITDFTAIDNVTTADALLVQLYYEYARGFVGEDAIEWLALLRLPFNTVKTLRPTITNQIQYILPIPHSEIVNNINFGDQNPGYQR
ncbi:RagB/SusD family nutrient uptake outer membrane protein [Mucilaginibacter aquaedulcis]|uniref:RagB/SusD family nutrient uptake outer membrane protein n=1 Tax=Mucilaginibacter aquaedulcis TaxID=1187081 RepID=UPI0025B4181C|nr:RagB/SusD family nutrient uptake outer membrane protein [Mucilaginibacter aquaedulcis]MDN3548661.1 RagB/SusD family nutrient uptake outer membrane protein [Mucilaginibacter aquaedulcis]